MKVLYGKLGRAMPLTLEKCGTLGGDVECIPVVKALAQRHPDDTFYLFGRNSGEVASAAGLPTNVINPWTEYGWRDELRTFIKRHELNGNFTVDEQRKLIAFMDSMVRPLVDEADGVVGWIGQHGTTNQPTPGITKKSSGQLTRPQDFSVIYCSFFLNAINRFRDADPFTREEVWLNADSRNYLKMRDLAWPLLNPVLTQRTYDHTIRHERGDRPTYVDANWDNWTNARTLDKNGHLVWESTVRCVYSRLEINALMPGTPFGDLVSYSDDFDRPGRFGLFINEARTYVSDATKRVNALRDYALPARPHFVHGTWSKKSQDELGVDITPAPWSEYYPKLHSVRCTLTTPSSGSGFATTKPWEAFAAGTVCFFHPLYDDQNHILGGLPDVAQRWLRVKHPGDFQRKLHEVSNDRDLWEWLVREQRAYFEREIDRLRYIELIEGRLYG